MFVLQTSIPTLLSALAVMMALGILRTTVGQLVSNDMTTPPFRMICTQCYADENFTQPMYGVLDVQSWRDYPFNSTACAQITGAISSTTPLNTNEAQVNRVFTGNTLYSSCALALSSSCSTFLGANYTTRYYQNVSVYPNKYYPSGDNYCSQNFSHYLLESALNLTDTNQIYSQDPNFSYTPSSSSPGRHLLSFWGSLLKKVGHAVSEVANVLINYVVPVAEWVVCVVGSSDSDSAESFKTSPNSQPDSPTLLGVQPSQQLPCKFPSLH